MTDPSASLLRHDPAFRWYWLGQATSSAGSQVTMLALPLVTALLLDGGPREVSLVATAGMAPYLFFSLLAGHLLEGRDERRVMIPADLAQALLIGAVPLCWALGVLSVPLLAVIAFLAGTAAMLFGLTSFAYVPRLVDVEELPAANRAVQATRTVNEIGGPGIAGFLVGALGPAVAMVIDAFSYVASAFGVAAGQPRHERRVDPEDERPPLRAGFRLLFGNRYLRALTVHASLFNLAEQVVVLNLVVWAVRDQNVPESAYGLAIAAGGVGGLLGTLTALQLADRLGLGRAFLVSLGFSCGAPLLLALHDWDGIGLAVWMGCVMVLAGFGLGNANVYSLTLRQTVIPPERLARSAGAYTQVMYGSIPLGSLLAGVVGEGLGTRAAVVVGAVGLVISILPMATRPIRTLSNPTAAAAVAEV